MQDRRSQPASISRFPRIRYKDCLIRSEIFTFFCGLLGLFGAYYLLARPREEGVTSAMPVLLGEPEQPQIDISALEARSPGNQRRRMLLALCLLLTALILVLVRYREFWLTPGT